MEYNILTSEEKRIIVHKGTEPPHSGEYNNNKKTGTYVCRRCNYPLYRSNDKFESNCGWSSFDDQIKGGVALTNDDNGNGIEIVCTNCDAHLGHLFRGEGFTAKNTRHCVNSTSLKFIPATISKPTESILF